MTRELDEILSGAAPAEEQVTAAEPEATEPTPEPQNEGQPRGADGKFAPKATEADQTTQAAVEGAEPAAERPNGMVPQPALHAAREKARTAEERAEALERMVSELTGKVSVLTQQRQAPEQPQEQAPPLEIWDDPNKFVETALTPLQQELARTRLFYSRRAAITEHGQDTVTAAETAMQEAIARGELDPATVRVQLGQSLDPVGDVVSWHQNSPANREAALREKLRAELMAELGQQPPAQPAAPAPAGTPAVMPSNLAGARNVGTRSGPEWAGPQPLESIFASARAKKAG